MTTARAAPTGAMTFPTQLTRFSTAPSAARPFGLALPDPSPAADPGFGRETSWAETEMKRWPGDKQERAERAPLSNSKASLRSSCGDESFVAAGEKIRPYVLSIKFGWGESGGSPPARVGRSYVELLKMRDLPQYEREL